MSTPQRPNQLLITLPAEQRERLDRLKERTGRNRSELVRAAVAEYLLRMDPPLPTCCQCGTPAPVAGYCSKGPLCPECF